MVLIAGHLGLQPSSTLQPSIALQPYAYIAAKVIDDDAAHLQNGQYEIDDLVFGTRDIRLDPNPYLVETFDITPGQMITGAGGNLSSGQSSAGSMTTADASYPNEDGTKFGQDYYTGMMINLSMNVWQRGQVVYDHIGKMQGVWRNPKFRKYPNAVTTLRMKRSDRTRLVYGRPRDFKATYGEVERGFSPIDATFQCINELFYDDEVKVQQIGIQNPPVDGLAFPTTVPFVLQQYAEAYTTVHVGGDYPTWPVFELHGPCINPTVQYDNEWLITLLVALDHTQSIVIDPRPWRRMTLKIGVLTENISGSYTQDSPVMREMQLDPGQHTLLFNAVDPTLTSYMTVSWRNAYTTP